VAAALVLGTVVPAGAAPPPRRPAARFVPPPAPTTRTSHTYVLHLPGISGPLIFDHLMLKGLANGGIAADTEIYDWTCKDPGIGALQAYDRNQKQAQLAADKITARFRSDPQAHINLIGHSGGGGMAVWVLEKLPADVMVDSVLLLAPAISPRYDLSAALRHVRGHMYGFSSRLDSVVLGAGTKVFGTIDRVHTEAAGMVGFERPESADAAQYQKFVPMPYDGDWFGYGNIGDHIGPMNPIFAKRVLAPLLLGAAQPQASQAPVPAAATTQPVSTGT
jgi:pimeloyl-ACP methyl ester carboxylesterase